MLSKVRICFFSLLLFSNLSVTGCGGEGSESSVEAQRNQGTEETGGPGDTGGTEKTGGAEETLNKGQVDDVILIKLINQLND